MAVEDPQTRAERLTLVTAATASRVQWILSLAAIATGTLRVPVLTIATVGLTLSDFCLAALLVVFLKAKLHTQSLVGTLSGERRPMVIATAGWLLVCLVSFLVNPSIGGVAVLIRAAAVAVLVAQLAAAVRAAAWGGLAVVASMVLISQAMIGAVQVMTGEVTGIALFSEGPWSLRPINGLVAPSGSFGHTNIAANVCVVLLTTVVLAFATGQLDGDRHAVDRVIAVSGVAGGAALIGASFSRTAAMAVLVVAFSLGLVFLRSRRNRTGSSRESSRRAIVVSLLAVISMTVAVAVRAPGWIGRFSQADGAETAEQAVEQLGSGRMALIRQGLAIWETNPVLGTGPGRYYAPAVARPEIAAMSNEQIPVHNLWLYLLAVTGVIGAAAFGVVTLLVGRSTWSHPLGRVLPFALVPLLALDAALFTSTGLLYLAVAIGVALGISVGPSGVVPSGVVSRSEESV
jgi:hypothetical protein